VTYDTGTGGNLSDFLKARIGEYEDIRATSDDPVQMVTIMDRVAKAVDLYGDTLQASDIVFDEPQEVLVEGERNLRNIRELVAEYKELGVEDKQNLAVFYLDSMSSTGTNVTRDYGGRQREAENQGDVEASAIEAYHSKLYPARTNVSNVLNPYIERIMDARSAGDKEGIYNSMRDLQNVVEDQDLDDLLGSAGTNIRGALGDLHSSAEQIGADAALERTSRHVLKQYQDLAEQRVEQDPGLFGEGLEG